jgi:hypothetical protein
MLCHTRRLTSKLYTAVPSLHVPLKKFTVEITPDGIVDEPFRCLGLSTCLVLENHIIVPPSLNTEGARIVDINQRVSPHQFSLLHLGLLFCLLPLLNGTILVMFP